MEPITRKEVFLNAMCADKPCDLDPVSREEILLKRLVEAEANEGGGSGLPAGSKPNQYIVTDGDGNAKWEDRLAWSELTKSYSDTLTWDGVLSDDDPSVKVGGHTQTYHRVSDEVPSVEQLSSGGIYTMCQNSGFMDAEFTSNEVVDRTSEGIIGVGPVVVACIDNVTFGGCTFPKSGIYFLSMTVGYISGFKVNGYQFGAVTETIHPIDKKYLPSGCSHLRVVITMDENENYLSSHNYEEIKNHVLSGGTCDCVMGSYIMCLTEATFMHGVQPFMSASQAMFMSIGNGYVVNSVAIEADGPVYVRQIQLSFEDV